MTVSWNVRESNLRALIMPFALVRAAAAVAACLAVFSSGCIPTQRAYQAKSGSGDSNARSNSKSSQLSQKTETELLVLGQDLSELKDTALMNNPPVWMDLSWDGNMFLAYGYNNESQVYYLTRFPVM